MSGVTSKTEGGKPHAAPGQTRPGAGGLRHLDGHLSAYYNWWFVRSYIVIPEGTPVIRVEASTPHFAASKVQRGKGEHATSGEPSVLPSSALIEINEAPRVIPGQLTIAGALRLTD